MNSNTSSIHDQLTAALQPLQAVLAELEPRDVPLPEVTGVWELFSRVRRLAGNGETLLAGRLGEAREWARSGYASPEEWMAAKSGTSVGEARGQMQTSERLGRGLDETAERLRQGRISPQQAGIVADAATVNPNAERALCDQAERDSNRNLSDEARRRKAQRDDGEERARRHHRDRRARVGTGRDGAPCLTIEGPAARLAAFLKELEAETDRRYRAATNAGRRESHDAHAFDAFCSLIDRVNAGTTTRSPKQLAMIRVDLPALVRGSVADDEVCEIAGYGPISVSEARALLSESILYLVCTKGVDVLNITHLGRGPNRVQELAILWASQTCRVLGCHRTHTQYDHRVEFVESQHTRIDETDLLCDVHHKLKTFKGWALVTGTGDRDFVPPGDERHPAFCGPPVAGTVPPDAVAADRATPTMTEADELIALEPLLARLSAVKARANRQPGLFDLAQ